jgi:DNA-binding MarR family transcriptional regulator
LALYRWRSVLELGHPSGHCDAIRSDLVFLSDIYDLDIRTAGAGIPVSVAGATCGANLPYLCLSVGGVVATGYYEVIALTERLHRQFLEVVKLELDGLGIHDINNVQGLMLFNIGDAEMTVGELTLRGCYLGSNVSYSVKKLVENGYLAQERSVHDLRSTHVRLTEKGSKLRDRLLAMHQRHVEMLNQTAITDEDLTAATVTLRRLERFWVHAGDLVGQPGRRIA